MSPFFGRPRADVARPFAVELARALERIEVAPMGGFGARVLRPRAPVIDEPLQRANVPHQRRYVARLGRAAATLPQQVVEHLGVAVGGRVRHHRIARSVDRVAERIPRAPAQPRPTERVQVAAEYRGVADAVVPRTPGRARPLQHGHVASGRGGDAHLGEHRQGTQRRERQSRRSTKPR